MLLLTQLPPHVTVETQQGRKQLPLSQIDCVHIDPENLTVTIYGVFAAKHYKKEFQSDQKIAFEEYSKQLLQKFDKEEGKPRQWTIITADSWQIAANLANIQAVIHRKNPNNHKIMFKGTVQWVSFDQRNFNQQKVAAIYNTLFEGLRDIDENKPGVIHVTEDFQNVCLCSRFCCAIELHQSQRSVTLKSHAFPDGSINCPFDPEMPLGDFREPWEQLDQSVWEFSDKTDRQNPNSVLYYLNIALKGSEVFQHFVKPFKAKSSEAN